LAEAIPDSQQVWHWEEPIAGALMLLLLGISYNRYQLKQRNNQLLEAKQQEINQKNQSLQQVLGEKEDLLLHKDALLEEQGVAVKGNSPSRQKQPANCNEPAQ
jgi:hypothetical protein